MSCGDKERKNHEKQQNRSCEQMKVETQFKVSKTLSREQQDKIINILE